MLQLSYVNTPLDGTTDSTNLKLYAAYFARWKRYISFMKI